MNEKLDLAKLGKKRCTLCKEIKPLDEFWKSKNNFLGRLSRCNICSQIYDKKFSKKRLKRDKNPKAKQYRKEYIYSKKEWWREYENQYRKLRRDKDVYFKIKSNFSSRISSIIKNKTFRTKDIIGCDKDAFLKHIECKFTEGMGWGNYGKKGWHIDHIIPISKFDLTKEEEIKKCFHYTNLQPLWWKDNLIKSNKIAL